MEVTQALAKSKQLLADKGTRKNRHSAGLFKQLNKQHAKVAKLMEVREELLASRSGLAAKAA